MTPRTIILLVLAVLMVGGTVYFVQTWVRSERQQIEAMKRQPAKVKPTTFVLVASKDLPAGTFVKTKSMHWQAWPRQGLSPAYLLKGKATMKQFVGSVVRRGITAGEPLTKARVVKRGERGFLSAVLNPGMRALTVPINATSGIAGLVFPGDRVDLILTHAIRRGVGRKRTRKFVSETVLTAIRVLAIDQKTNDQKGKPVVAKTATFEVTPKQAEIITVAAELGRLSLSLRSLARADGAPVALKPNGKPMTAAESAARPPNRGRTYTWDNEVSRMIDSRPDETVTILRGGRSEASSIVRARGNGARRASSAVGRGVAAFVGATAKGLKGTQ